MLTLTACSTGTKSGNPDPAGTRGAVTTAALSAPKDCATVVSGGGAEALAAGVSEALFASAPLVVLAPALDQPALRTAAGRARELGVPLLVDEPPAALPPVDTNPTPTESPTTGTPTNTPATARASATPTATATPRATPRATPTLARTESRAAGAPCPPIAAALAPPTAGPTAGATPATAIPSASATVGATPATATPSASAAATETASATPTPGPISPTLTPVPAIDSSCVITGIEPVVAPPPSPSIRASAPGATPSASVSPTPTGEPSAGPSQTPTALTGSPSPTAPAVPPAERSWAREIRRLNAKVVLALDPAVAADATAALPGVTISTAGGNLPATAPAKPLPGLTVFVEDYRSPRTAEGDRVGAIAGAATALAAGARVLALPAPDPRAGACAVEALAGAHPEQVLAVGGDFGTPERLAQRVVTASTSAQLPGGGALFFPGRRLVALYGHPDAPELGALGQQGLAASIDRAGQVAGNYRPLSDVTVVPAFEIITTTAVGSPIDGTYSAKTSIDQLRPWVERAGAAGMYVVLDLQPGLQDALVQAKLYEPLLELPWVGLAVDPEWKLQPGQHPLGQIGGIDAGELNSVSSWLSDLTARHNLPQKLFVIHQFRKSMILDEPALNTDHDNLAMLIHMDGQGKQSDKDATWKVVKSALPPGIHWLGWKDFYVKDHPTPTVAETMAKEPTPVMISYQ